jgi:hypothetical protein
VIRRNVSNKVGGLGGAKASGSNSESTHRLTLVGAVPLVD